MSKLWPLLVCAWSLFVNPCFSSQNSLDKEHSPEQNNPPKEFLLTKWLIDIYKQRALELSQQWWSADCETLLNWKEIEYYKLKNAVVKVRDDTKWWCSFVLTYYNSLWEKKVFNDANGDWVLDEEIGWVIIRTQEDINVFLSYNTLFAKYFSKEKCKLWVWFKVIYKLEWENKGITIFIWETSDGFCWVDISFKNDWDTFIYRDKNWDWKLDVSVSLKWKEFSIDESSEAYKKVKSVYDIFYAHDMWHGEPQN